MSRWLRSAMNKLEYSLIEKYRDMDLNDIPDSDKSILLADPLACAEFAIYYEKKNGEQLPYEWYESIARDKEAGEWYSDNAGLYNLEATEPVNKFLD